MEKSKFYISTAIAYTSGKPHIGNTYEIVLADVIARYKRLCGYDVYFQTGTDEHGEKIEEKAKEVNVLPQEYVDDKAKTIKEIWDVMDTSYDRFVRTTDLHHKEIVQKIVDANPNQVEAYKNGKTNLLGFFVGQVMKETKGRANPKTVNEFIRKFLEG